jgi:hypothetical protein
MAYTLPVVYYLLVIVGIVLRVTHLLMIVLSGTAMAVKLGNALILPKTTLQNTCTVIKSFSKEGGM